MIGQNSNNKATGYTAKECDAGIPISGRTGQTGSYEIIKTLADGTLAGFPTYIPSLAYQGFSINTFAIPGGTPPSNTFLGKSGAFTLLNDGQYSVNPVFIYPGAAGGGISFVLYKSITNLGTYMATLVPFNAFNPTSTDMNDGLYGYWHNTTSQSIGNTLMYAYNRSNTLSTFLTTGQYYLAAITDGATNFSPGVGLIGFNEFVKIA